MHTYIIIILPNSALFYSDWDARFALLPLFAEKKEKENNDKENLVGLVLLTHTGVKDREGFGFIFDFALAEWQERDGEEKREKKG